MVGANRRRRQNQDPGSIHSCSGRNLQQPPKVSLETQPNQVCLRRTLWKTTQIHRKQPRNRGQSREDQRHHGHGCSCYYQGRAEAYRLHGSSELILVQVWRTGLTLLQASKVTRQIRVTTEAAEALENLKHHLQSPPTLTAPLPGEELLLYIAATTHVVSTAIVVERLEEGHA